MNCLTIGSLAFLLMLSYLCVPTSDAQPQGRTSSAVVGASMALLATLQDAAVLPPEGTKEANRVVQTVIQLQAVFMKSQDESVRQFFDHAMVAKWGSKAREQTERFMKRGWTSEVLEALSDYYRTRSEAERHQLSKGLDRFNMRLSEMELLSDLYERARASYYQSGRDIHQVFIEHRRHMPGGQQDYRKEHRDGNQSLYPYQS